MKTPSIPPASRWPDTLAILARWVLGLLFIYMGLTKALQPIDFLKLVRQYDMVDTPFLLNSIAVFLPWFEVWCGLLLLTGIAVRGSALIIAVMLVAFTLLVLKRALEIHATQAIPFCGIKFNCGCGGGDVWICRKLTENSLLVLLALWLVLAGRGQGLCARYQLQNNSAQTAPRFG